MTVAAEANTIGPASLVTDTACYAGLVLARILPVIAFTPLFGGEAASRRLRMSLAILIALPLSLYADVSPLRDIDRATYALLVAKEVLVGAGMASLVAIAFEALGAAGALMDIARGQSMASVLDPQSHQSVSPLSTFMRQAAFTLFLTIGGYAIVFEAFHQSLQVLSPTCMPASVELRAVLLEIGIGAIPSLFLIAVKLALPAFAASLIVDAVMGMIGRASPTIQTYFLAMPLRALACFVIIMLSIHAAQTLLGREVGSLVEAIAAGLGL